MGHPGTKQHTSNVMHKAHAARIATMITTATTIGIVTVCSSMSGLQLSSTAASYRRGEPDASVFLRERSNSQLRYTQFVQDVWLVGVLLKQFLRQLCDWDLQLSPASQKVYFVVGSEVLK